MQNKNNKNNEKMIKIKRPVSQKYQLIPMDIATKLSKLGLQIRKIRKEKKMSSDRFCDLLGISRPTLQSLEEGVPNISLYNYLLACKELGLDVEIIIKKREEK